MQMSKEIHILKLDDILPNRFQPRIVFDEAAINELTESIKQYGVIEPIIVRKVADKYEIIAGERRYKASVLAGKDTIPAIITDLNDKDSAEVALIENVQRQNLTPIEEAVSYRKILDMGYMNQSELAEKLGKTQSTIANKLRLLNLTDTVQEALLQERISERHARSLLRLPSDKQDDMLDRIIKNRMTVRKTDEEINKILAGESSDTPSNPTLEVEKNVVSEPIKTEEIKEEKEENSMNNNDFMNQFNIPNTPIIEPTSVQPVGQQNMGVNNEIPPFIPAQPIEQPNFAPNPSVEPTVSSFGMENNGMPQQQNVQPFNPMQPEFVINPSLQQPITETQPVGQQNMSMVQPNNAMMNMGEPIPQTITNEPANESNDDTPIGGRFFNMFGETVEPTNMSSTNQPIIEQQQNMNFNPFGSDTMVQQPQVPSSEIVQPMNTNYSEPIPMPNVPITPEMQQPNPQPELINTIQPFQLNDNQEFTNASVVELGAVNNRMEEPALQPLMENDGPKITMDMKQVINLIRDCAGQIERSGYTIDTDELDFDDHYQVIFKINKID